MQQSTVQAHMGEFVKARGGGRGRGAHDSTEHKAHAAATLVNAKLY